MDSTGLAANADRFSESHVTAPEVETLQETLGITDLDPELLRHALTHRSYAYENGMLPNNERLEFLGDSVLGLVITDTLFRIYPDLPEGQLAKLRAAIVSAKSLAMVAEALGIGEHVLLGRGEQASGGGTKSSILSDTMEAILGAVYVQFGIERAAEVIHTIFDPVIANAAELGAALDWKTSLQEISAEHGLGVPSYVLNGTGPAHAKEFTAEVVLNGYRFDGGHGRSKKEAEQMVAEIAWRAIKASETSQGAESDSGAGTS
ncbi:MAG: ribonuclease III [Actinomycetales bacterium]|nr:ribonuclease III [Actinomycetales bacterium]